MGFREFIAIECTQNQPMRHRTYVNSYFFEKNLDKNLTISRIQLLSAGVAQLVERNLAKVEVASSRLVSRSNFFPRRLAIENLFCTWDNAFVCV